MFPSLNSVCQVSGNTSLATPSDPERASTGSWPSCNDGSAVGLTSRVRSPFMHCPAQLRSRPAYYRASQAPRWHRIGGRVARHPCPALASLPLSTHASRFYKGSRAAFDSQKLIPLLLSRQHLQSTNKTLLARVSAIKSNQSLFRQKHHHIRYLPIDLTFAIPTYLSPKS